MVLFVEGTFTDSMRVCAKHRNGTYNTTTCASIRSYQRPVILRLPPGGNFTVHFDQLVVADVITIANYRFLTLCEVDVLGAEVVLATDGKLVSSDLSYLQLLTVPLLRLSFTRIQTTFW